jgi:hypothetical protein
METALIAILAISSRGPSWTSEQRAADVEAELPGAGQLRISRSMLAEGRRKSWGRAITLILCLGSLWLATRPVSALDPLPLPASGASRQWDGPQFVAADRSGHVFLLRTRTLQVYPVEKTGALGEPERLEATLAVTGEVQNAALDASGSQWLIQTFGAVHLFADRKEKALPRLAWLPNSVGFRRDEPIVAVLPVVVGTRQGGLGDTPPWLVRPSGEQWTSPPPRPEHGRGGGGGSPVAGAMVIAVPKEHCGIGPHIPALERHPEVPLGLRAVFQARCHRSLSVL